MRTFILYTTDSEDYDASLGVPLGNWYIALPGPRRAARRMPPPWWRWNPKLDAGMTLGDMLRARGMRL